MDHPVLVDPCADVDKHSPVLLVEKVDCKRIQELEHMAPERYMR